MSELNQNICPKCHGTGIVSFDEVYGTMVDYHFYDCDCEDGKARKPKTDKEIIAELAAENEALKARVAELEKHLPSEYLQTQTGLPRYVTKLKADNARMREALQELYNLNLCPDYKTGASRENLFAEIAREALKGEG